MKDLIRFGPRRRETDRHRIKAGVAEPAERDRHRTVRLEVDRSDSRALTDGGDRGFDETNSEERLPLARAPERDDGSSAFKMARPRLGQLLRSRPEGGWFGRRRVGIVGQHQHLRRSLVPRRGDRQRAIVTTQECVRGGAAAIVLRAARELPEHAVRWVVALCCGDPREKIGCGSAVGRAGVRIERDR